jgi:hypothetical protein
MEKLGVANQAIATDDYERITLNILNGEGKNLILSSDPDSITIHDVASEPNPFDGLRDPFGLLEVDDVSELYRKRIMAEAHGLARVLTDTKDERRSLQKGQKTKLAEVAIEDICSFTFSAQQDKEKTSYWLERSDTEAGFVLIENADGSVLVRTSEIEGQISLDTANKLIEGGSTEEPSQDSLFSAAQLFLIAFAESVGLDPKKLSKYTLEDNVLLGKYTDARGVERDVKRHLDGTLIIKIGTAAFALATLGIMGAGVYRGISDNSDNSTDIYTQDYEINNGVESKVFEINLSEYPEHIFHTSPEGIISYVPQAEFDTSNVLPISQTDFGVLAKEGVQSMTVAQDGVTCLIVNGDFSAASSMRTGAFHQDESIGEVVAFHMQDNEIMFCKADQTRFHAGDTIYIVQELR